jgi:hypothetical protein
MPALNDRFVTVSGKGTAHRRWCTNDENGKKGQKRQNKTRGNCDIHSRGIANQGKCQSRASAREQAAQQSFHWSTKAGGSEAMRLANASSARARKRTDCPAANINNVHRQPRTRQTMS